MTSQSSARRALYCALLFTAVLGACKCGDKTQVAGCQSDADCQSQHNGDARWTCDKTQSPAVCVEQPRQCDTTDDCCPGQVCNSSGHFCADKYTPCTGPGSCPAQGQICATIGVFPQGQGCTFNKCNADGSCTDSSTTCFNHFCVGEPPCQGGCGASKVCVTETNLCSPAPKDASCQRTCSNGQMLVLSNPTNIFDTCQPPETCECDSLPPLISRDLGRHSSSAVSGSNLIVSTYDGTYGDLVVFTFDKSNPVKPTKGEWLDGVPTSGHIGGDVNGPRHGITDPGVDVGQYSSLAADPAGNLFISYYDVTNGDLKFIARYGGAWTTPITIDGSDASGNMTGDVGLYSSIALTSGGIPAIAYFRRGSFDATAQAETGKSTALLYAVATKANPTSRGDWVVLPEVEKMDKPAAPCNGSCPSNKVCVDEGGGVSLCEQPAASTAPCSPACTGTQACVAGPSGGDPSSCKTSLTASVLVDLPPGIGVTPALAFVDDKPLIAYYDSVNKALKAALGTNSGTAPAFGAPVILDGMDPTPAPKRDVGRFPSIAVAHAGTTGGRIAIAFGDLTSSTLLLYQADTLIAHAQHDHGNTVGNIHVVDSGLPKQDDANEPWHPQTIPGVQSSMLFTPNGNLAIAYQDATPVDLRLAVYTPANNKATHSTLRSQGAAGFWPHLSLDGSTAYVTSATIKAATAQVPGNTLQIDTKANVQ